MSKGYNHSEMHSILMSSYIFHRFLYSLSFEKKIEMDLGIACYYISSYSKELDALSDEELSKRMDELKKPWWYDVYEEVFCDREHFFEVLYPQYKHSTLGDVRKDENAWKALCNNHKAHKSDEMKLIAIYPHLHDKELKEALESHDSGRLVEFIQKVLADNL